MPFSHATYDCAFWDINPSSVASFDCTQEAPTTRPVVKLPTAARSPLSNLYGNLAHNPVTPISSPVSTIIGTLNSVATQSSGYQNAGVAEYQPVPPNPTHKSISTAQISQGVVKSACHIAKGDDSQRLVIEDKLRSGLAKLGLGTAEGFKRADDPDLPPIPDSEDKSNSQDGFKGLKASRWAEHEDQSSVPTGGSKQKKEINSRRTKLQPRVDIHVLGNKLKRELSQCGLMGRQQSTKNVSLPSKPSFQPSITPSSQASPQAYTKDESTREVPRLYMDVEEFQRDVKEYGLKTFKDSRWASKDDSKEEAPYEVPAPVIEVKESRWASSNQYGVPGIQVDKEDFEREVKEYGFKTLKDSRWA
ncbi:hypothetical protein F5Y10DRAFT_272828 [Nemania abortiva]|nr:hypothetical protein F5Y10DRAFT_272828 [Nemania abortiva]